MIRAEERGLTVLLNLHHSLLSIVCSIDWFDSLLNQKALDNDDVEGVVIYHQGLRANAMLSYRDILPFHTLSL